MDKYKLEELSDRLKTVENILTYNETMVNHTHIWSCFSQILESLRIIKSELSKVKQNG